MLLQDLITGLESGLYRSLAKPTERLEAANKVAPSDTLCIRET